MADPSAVRPGLWVLNSHVEDFDLRAAVVMGRHGAVLFDTLARPAELALVDDLLGDRSLTVVYSHGDWDHIWGTSGLGDRWQEVIAHEHCAHRFEEEIPETLARKQGTEDGSGNDFEDVVLVPPTRTFQDTAVLDLGGVTVELSHLPGHTMDSVVGFLPEWGVFLAGDSVESPVPFLNPESPLDDWIRGLALWLRRLEEPQPTRASPLIIPSHGPMGGPELILRVHRYIQDILRGAEPEVPADLTTFYAQTHAYNRSIGKAWQQRA